MTRPHFSPSSTDRVLVCDGAMGTMLYAKGIFLNRSFDELNLTKPDLVADVHQIYSAARRGRARDEHVRRQPREARRLRPGGPGARGQPRRARGSPATRRAIRRGSPAPSARSASASSRGAGPASTKPRRIFAEQARALLEGGVDLFVLETFRDVNEIGAAIRGVRSVCALPIVAQMTTEEDGNTSDGVAPETFVPELERHGADVVGPELQRRPGDDARDHRAARAGRDRQALGAAERRQAARDRRPQHLSLLAGVHGVVRAALHRRRRPAGRRLLRHDARAHPADQAGGPRAVAQERVGPSARAAATAPAATPGRRRPRSCARAAEVADGECARARHFRRQRRARAAARATAPRRSSSRRASCASSASTSSTFPDGPRATGRMSALAAAVMVQQHGASRRSFITPAAIAT